MTRSTPASTYDDDFYAWTQEQAAALRRMPAPSGDVDVAHLAEEIEDSAGSPEFDVDAAAAKIAAYRAEDRHP